VGTKRMAKKGHAKQEKPDGHLTNNGEIVFFFAKWKKKPAEKCRQAPTFRGQHTTHKYINLL
jgi:hypothetical protein